MDNLDQKPYQPPEVEDQSEGLEAEDWRGVLLALLWPVALVIVGATIAAFWGAR